MKYINKGLSGKLVPHVVAVVVFVVVAAIYCKPVFENKILFQEDVLQWQGMAHSSFQYKDTHGHFPLWTNSMFGGMPAFQIAMEVDAPSIQGICYALFTLFLKKPASFFFLACICFYFLTGVLRINPYIGIIGGLAYAYATYNPVIVAVGHDTKMQAIALLPAFIASVILVCERKYWQGLALTALFSGMLVATQHMQIVYYGLIIAVCMFLAYVVRWLRAGDLRSLVRAGVILVAGGMVGVLCNAVALLTTYDSSKETTRGGSDLADTHGNYSRNGLSESAAFNFSMYKAEPLVMLVPNIYGGSTEMELPASKAQAILTKMPTPLASQVGVDGPRYYWGGIGEFVSGPPYAGAIICFLALAGFFILDNKQKWWILGACILAVVMSWGSYFQAFNSFLLRTLPMYNKFRAPSMIIIVPTFLLCMQAVLSLQKILESGRDKAFWYRYRWALLSMLGFFGILVILYFKFDYSGAGDAPLLTGARAGGSQTLESMSAFIDALRSDRRHLFLDSMLRSFGFILAAAILIGLHIRGKLPGWLFLSAVGILAFVDVMGIDLHYLNGDNYKERKDYQQNFIARDADRQVMRDSGFYRVFDLRDNVSNALSYGAMTAYFHRSIGGYHAAKLKIYEDLINHQLYNYPNCRPVINMLNTKYIIRPGHSGGDTVIENADALGPAWFVHAVRFEHGPQAVMDGLTHFHPKDTAILFDTDQQGVTDGLRGRGTVAQQVRYDLQRTGSGLQPDTTASLQLVVNDNDLVIYKSFASSPEFAVFSEIFYNRGWRAWVDDREVPILRTDYVLRGLNVPAGRHMIRFVFQPTSYYLGRQMQWMAFIIMLMFLAGAILVTLQEQGVPLPEFRSRPVSSY